MGIRFKWPIRGRGFTGGPGVAVGIGTTVGAAVQAIGGGLTGDPGAMLGIGTRDGTAGLAIGEDGLVGRITSAARIATPGMSNIPDGAGTSIGRRPGITADTGAIGDTLIIDDEGGRLQARHLDPSPTAI